MAERKIPDIVIDLVVIEKGGQIVFQLRERNRKPRDLKEVSFLAAPLWTKAELLRNDKVISTAYNNSHGTHAPTEGWQGEEGSVLVQDHSSSARPGWRYRLQPTSGYRVGDVLRLTMPGYELDMNEQYRSRPGGWPKRSVSRQHRIRQLIPGR